MSLRGRKNLPVGSSISSWAGAPAILDDTASAPRIDALNARSLAEEPVVRFYARRHRCPRPGSIESNELIQSRKCSSAVCGRSISSYRSHTEALGSSAQMRCVSC
jgi:hypothetical protein